MPSLEKGWNFFEHYTLGRYIDPFEYGESADLNSGTTFLAFRGEKTLKTHLYSFTCPEQDLSNFGIGIQMYFASLRTVSIIFFLTFLINLPLYIFFQSEEYSESQDGLPFPFKGSAICTKELWQPCPKCTRNEWTNYPLETDRYAVSELDPSLRFIKINDCSISYGIFSWIACIFVAIMMALKRSFEKGKAIVYDDLSITTSDYSIQITNPPPDARDPEGEFFLLYLMLSIDFTPHNKTILLYKQRVEKLLFQSL